MTAWQVKHAQGLADHCAHLEAALSQARSKLPHVREITTQTERSFLSEVHAERNEDTVAQQHIEHEAYAGTVWQPTDAEQGDNGMVIMQVECCDALASM